MLTSKDFAKNYAHFLNHIARKAKSPGITNSDKLLKKLLGNNSTISVFKYILSWLPYSKREDGLVYKSAPELADKCIISERTAYRCISILKDKPYIIHKVKRANGSPTGHFDLNLDAFLKAIGEVLGIAWTQITAWLDELTGGINCQDGRNEDLQNPVFDTIQPAKPSAYTPPELQAISCEDDTFDPAKSTPSITDKQESKNKQNVTGRMSNTTPVPTHHPVYSSFQMERLQEILQTSYRNIAAWVDQYGADRFEAVVASVQNTPRIRNRGAWARNALENNYQLKTTAADVAWY